MSSQRKIDSARANGAKSRGPVTEEGKAISSQNGIRHGLLAQTVVLEGESKDRFEQLHVSLIAEFQPRTPAENALVDTMTIARWRHLRVLGVQKAGFDLEMARQPGLASPVQRAAAAFKSLADNSRVLDLLHRYETSYDRQFTRALNALLKLRAASDVLPLPPPTNDLCASAPDPTPSPAESNFPTEPNPKIEPPITPPRLSRAPQVAADSSQPIAGS